MKRMVRAVLLLVVCGLSYGAQAQTCTNTGTGNWGTVGIWNCTLPAGARVPLNTDNVVIINNTTVTVNIAGAVAGSVTINGGANATSLTMGGVGTTLTVTNAGGRSGNVVINAPTANVTKQIVVGARSLTVTGNMTLDGGTGGGGGANISQLSVTTGSASIGGNLIINAGTVNTNVARATVTTGSIAVTGDATLTGGGTNSRDALISVTGVSATTGVTVDGALNINATVAGSSAVTLGVAGSSMRVTGAVTNNDTLTVGLGTFTAQSTLSTGSAASAIAATTSVTTGALNVTGNTTVTSGTNGLKTMTVGNGTIAIGGALDVTAALSGNDAGDATASVTGTGTMNITGNVSVTGGSNANRDALLTVTGASGVGAGVNIGGSLTINAAAVAASSTVSLTNASSRMRVTGGGGVINNDTLSVGVGIFSMTNAAATLTTGSGVTAIAATTSVTMGSLTVAGSAIVDSRTNGLKTLTVSNGTISIGGSLNVTAAAATADTGDATASVTGTGTMNITGNATVTGGSNANRDALLTVSGASGVGAGCNINGTLNINATVAASSSVTLGTGSRVTINGAGGVNNGGTVTVGAGIFTATNAAATYTNSNAAIVATTTVSTGSLTVAGPLTNATAEIISISSTGSINANGGFSNSGTFTNTAAGQLFLRGTANVINGTFTRGTGTVTMNGSALQDLSGTALTPPTTAGAGFNNLVINNAAGVRLGSGTVTVKGIMTLTSGEVNADTNSSILITETLCATAVSRPVSGGHVVGRLQKNIPAGNSNCTYEVGSAGAYTPVVLALVGAGVGRMIGRATAGDHPNIATSGLDPLKSVNSWWTLTTTGVVGAASASPGTFGATFTFVNPAGFDGGANTANFETERRTAGVWNTTTAGTRTGTTTQATGMTALGEFAVAEKKALVPTPGRFNAFEPPPGTAITGNIKTKISGVGFSLAVVAVNVPGTAQLTTFTDTVLVDLVGNNTLGVALDGNNCPTTFTDLPDISPNPTLTSGVATVNFAAVPESWRDVRVRIRWPAAGPYSVTSCSTNNFAIRPNAITGFTVSNNTRTTAGTANPLTSTAFSAVLHNAGRPFSVRASAVNGAGSPVVTANYVGAPVVTLTTCGPGAGFEACTATQGTLSLTTTFVAGLLSSDVASYDDVGSFNLRLIDDNFASVDGADSSVAERRIQSAVLPVGRFVPDNFGVALNVPVFAPACTGFTYQGQLFNYSTSPLITVTAREAGGATTTRYTGTWWRLTNSTLTPALQSTRYAAASGTLDTTTGLPAVAADPSIVDGGGGTGTLTFSSGSGLRFTRNNATPASEFDAEIALSINVIDADSVNYASNPAAFGAASAPNGILFNDADAGTTNDKRVRYGRLRLGNASGSQVLSLRVPIEAQYWNGTAFITNSLDNCTALAAGNIGLGNYVGSLGAGETTASIVSNPLQAGRSAIQLSAPGAGNPGSVDVTLNLGSGAAADACPAFTPAAAAGNLAHLRGRWCNPPGVYTKDPSARVRFGIRSNNDPTIYMRESQN